MIDLLAAYIPRRTSSLSKSCRSSNESWAGEVEDVRRLCRRSTSTLRRTRTGGRVGLSVRAEAVDPPPGLAVGGGRLEGGRLEGGTEADTAGPTLEGGAWRWCTTWVTSTVLVDLSTCRDVTGILCARDRLRDTPTWRHSDVMSCEVTFNVDVMFREVMSYMTYNNTWPHLKWLQLWCFAKVNLVEPSGAMTIYGSAKTSHCDHKHFTDWLTDGALFQGAPCRDHVPLFNLKAMWRYTYFDLTSIVWGHCLMEGREFEQFCWKNRTHNDLNAMSSRNVIEKHWLDVLCWFITSA